MALAEFIKACAGHWVGRESLRVPGQDHSVIGQAELTATAILDGQALTFDFCLHVQERSMIRTHATLFRTVQGVRMHWLADQIGGEQVYDGQASADELRIETAREDHRQSYHLKIEEGRLALRTLSHNDDGETVVREGVYQPQNPKIGTIGWFDLTVEDPGPLRDFYAAVCGWQISETDMGDYADYTMINERGAPVGGVCHHRGVNQGIPPVWLGYVLVADMKTRLEAVEALGGRVVYRSGDGGIAIIADPQGTQLALYQA